MPPAWGRSRGAFTSLARSEYALLFFHAGNHGALVSLATDWPCATPVRALLGSPGHDPMVPLWYHVVMAMNLRLDEEDSALLKALAEAEHVSLHEAALRAIRRSARELAHTDRVREATAEMLGRWDEVLDRLGHA